MKYYLNGIHNYIIFETKLDYHYISELIEEAKLNMRSSHNEGCTK